VFLIVTKSIKTKVLSQSQGSRCHPFDAILFVVNSPQEDFFKNNNAILPLLVDYVRGLIDSGEGHPTHLVDTYCGTGLFAITLSSRFEKVAGIELSQASIVSAKTMRN
jgi:tRNA/tmRNA/rRNA uracil-C5-methylase (TrmA/RlmC/RlmD family)